MTDAIMRSIYGWLFAVGFFKLLDIAGLHEDKWRLLALTIAFIPSWHFYSGVGRFIRRATWQ